MKIFKSNKGLLCALTLLIISSCTLDDKNSRATKENSKDNKEHVQAKNYSAHIVPKNMTVAEKKKRFLALVVPAVESVYIELTEQYEHVKTLVEQERETKQLALMRESYKVENNKELLIALKPHPKSITLAQAAVESAWGTSRFFTHANNVFGVWSFNKNEPRMMAGEMRGEKSIWVRKYPSIRASIKDYYRVLARGRAFAEFRQLKMKDSTPFEMIKKLDKYSEKRAEYTKQLGSMIRFNKFQKFD